MFTWYGLYSCAHKLHTHARTPPFLCSVRRRPAKQSDDPTWQVCRERKGTVHGQALAATRVRKLPHLGQGRQAWPTSACLWFCLVRHVRESYMAVQAHPAPAPRAPCSRPVSLALTHLRLLPSIQAPEDTELSLCDSEEDNPGYWDLEQVSEGWG